MKASHQTKMAATNSKPNSTNTPCNCTIPFCFFCTMNEQNPLLRASKITECFQQIPHRDDKESVLALSGLWNIAMNQPNNPEFPVLGIFNCMAKLIYRGINDQNWLFKDQNIYIPYYAAHIIGSYTMNKPQFAEIAVQSGVISPLIELLRGKISWVEQRVAVRALGHLASHENTFESISENGNEIVKSAMEIASSCLGKVYKQFICVKGHRLKYQSDLLTRGHGGIEIENRKAEEWALQTQCWSVHLLNYFARKEKNLNLICKKRFLKNLTQMWDGFMMISDAPAGIELLRTLCKTRIGRKSIADLKKVLKYLCNLARSSEDWQFMAIESLLNLLKDPETRFKVFEISLLCLVDLVELEIQNRRNPNLGDTITQVLLQDYHKIKYGDSMLNSEKAERALEEIWELKVERQRREKLMSVEEVRERKLSVGILKQQGNHKFRIGEIQNAIMKYTKGLDLCVTAMRKQRIVLYSNRAQCYLLQRNPEATIRDTTRALSLSMRLSKPGHRRHVHVKSLWRRSQAYDMKGLAKESLMDCLLFVSCRIKSKQISKHGDEKIPYYALRMINKQMSATWSFSSVKSRTWGDRHGGEEDDPSR